MGVLSKGMSSGSRSRRVTPSSSERSAAPQCAGDIQGRTERSGFRAGAAGAALSQSEVLAGAVVPWGALPPHRRQVQAEVPTGAIVPSLSSMRGLTAYEDLVEVTGWVRDRETDEGGQKAHTPCGKMSKFWGSKQHSAYGERCCILETRWENRS